MHLTRRQFLGLGALASTAAIGTYGFAIEPSDVEFTEHEINPGAGSRPVRFAQLTDLHFGGLDSVHRHIAEELSKRTLDFVVFTGDVVDDNAAMEALQDFLKLLPDDLPKYAIVGNWEHWGGVHFPTLQEVYRRANGRLLVNEVERISAAHGTLLLGGVDDYVGGMPSVEKMLRNVEPADRHIILSHCPIGRDEFTHYGRTIESKHYAMIEPIDIERYPIDCVLSGHTHGGQINVFGVVPFLPEGSGEYLKGWYRVEGPPLYVSRGIGTSIVPVRFGARPEVAVFTLWV